MSDGSLAHPEPLSNLFGLYPRTLQGEDGLVPLFSFGRSRLLHLLDGSCSRRTARLDASGRLLRRKDRMSSTPNLGEHFCQDYRDTACQIRGLNANGHSLAWLEEPLS